MRMQKINRKSKKLLFFIGVIPAALLLGIACMLPVFSADAIEEDHIMIDGTTYVIADSDVESLVAADLALIEWNAKGNSTEDATSADKITGVFEGQPVSGYWAVYGKIYERLLENATSNMKVGSSSSATIAAGTISIYRFYKDSSAADIDVSISASRTVNGTLIILADNTEDYENAILRASSSFTVSSGGALIIQGPTEEKKIKIQGNGVSSSARGSSLINVKNGSLYLINCEITDYSFGGNHAIYFSTGNSARYLYMANSTMSQIKGTEAGGIFCAVYGGNNSAASKSRLFIHDSYFYKCSTSGGNTVGGSAIRSYAADRCQLQVKNCIFEENTCTATGTSSGGGAIYWKSAEGKAVLIECQFIGNTATKVGGAVYNTGSMDIQKCTFVNNKATGTSSGRGCGGAIAVEPPYTSSYYAMDYQNLNGSLTLDQDTVIKNNTAANYGGGLYFNAFASQIGSEANEGTQIETFVMTLHINGATIQNNTAKYGGGIAMWLNYEDRSYTTGIYINADSKIVENSSSQSGGAIWMSSAENCECKENNGVAMSGGTLERNIAPNGGAIFVNTGKADASMNFAMSGGNVINNQATLNGGAVYVSGGNVTMSGGTITQNSAQNGGAVCVEGGAFAMSAGTIEALHAENGGAVYVSNGNATVSGGKITSYAAAQGQQTIPATATNGGAVCVNGGSFIISGGSIEKTAATLGGAVYVSGGNANVHGGMLTECSAEMGGAIYVVGGTVTMLDGSITNNQATNGNGGAIYVTGSTALQVTVQSGEISGNSASGNGGAISVIGQGTNEAITVQIGINELHYDPNGVNAKPPCDHNGPELAGDGNCPIVENNTCIKEGGAIYIAGTTLTNLNIYCITESGNRGEGNAAGSEETSLSDFLKVDGGKVLISAETSDPDAPEDEKIYYGNSVINSSIHVTGGDLTVKGTLANPAILAPITVDVVGEKGEVLGSFEDIRKNDERDGQQKYYVVRYFENYTEGDAQQATGQYTVHQTPADQPHTVWGVIYFHSGKTIVGWNTNPGGEAAGGKSFGVSSVISYNDFSSYLKGTTLELYAIWADNFYWIQFDPNTESYTGTMGDGEHKVSFLCAAENAPLPENNYVNRSYKFMGWSMSPTSKEIAYVDGAQIKKALTQEVGEVITLYAVWEICDHKDANKFVFAQGANASSMTCTCQCAYVVTATILAPTGSLKYNGASHPATIVYSNDNGGSFTESDIILTNQAGETVYFENLVISYDYTPILSEHVAVGVATDAGSYTANASFGGIPISVKFNITQATQPAPKRPEFIIETNPNTGNDELLVTNPAAGTTGLSGEEVRYKLVYIDGAGVEQPSEWTTEPRFTQFNSAWTLYYVVVYFPESNNYLKSDEIVSEQKYIFQGDINIVIVNDEGIAVTQPSEFTDDSGRVALISKSLTEYYISNEYSAIRVSGTLTYGNVVLDMADPEVFDQYFKKFLPNDEGGIGEFAYVVTPFDQNYSGEIKITFTGAKKRPTVDTYVAPDENFGAIGNTATTVSKDSAFTAYFEVNFYDPAVYENLTLWFDQALPAGATVIMVDKTDNSYWYAQGGSNKIALSSFKKMGGDAGALAVSEPSLKYQFIVDFSDESFTQSALTFKLTADKKDTYAPDLQEYVGGVTFASVTHSMGTPVVNGANATVEVGYAQGTAHASKWADREVALVLIPDANPATPLPIDVSVKVIQTLGQTTRSTTVTLDDNGRFVVTIDPLASKLEIVLQSQMFEEATYKFQVELYAAYKGSAPTNGILLADLANDLELMTAPRAQNAAKITIRDDKRIYSLTDTISGTIDIELAQGYTASVTLLKKHGADGYVSTGLSQVLNDGANTVEISNLDAVQEGDFCLSVVIRDASNTAVLTVPYYLVIQKTAS